MTKQLLIDYTLPSEYNKKPELEVHVVANGVGSIAEDGNPCFETTRLTVTPAHGLMHISDNMKVFHEINIAGLNAYKQLLKAAKIILN